MAELGPMNIEVGVKITMDDPRVTGAFNEWMRRFIEQPARFSREWQTVSEYLRQTQAGQEPTYGSEAAAYLAQLIVEQT